MARQSTDRRSIGRWLLGAAALACWLLWPAAALACTPPPGGPVFHTIAERVAAAPIVLEGTVTAVEGEFMTIASVDVHRYFKGAGGAQARISRFGAASICLNPVSAGERLIIFAQPATDATSDLAAFYLGQSAAVAPATDATRREVEAALGAAPPAAPPPPAQSGGTLPRELPATAAADGGPVSLLALAGGLALAIGMACALLVAGQRERQP